MTEVAVASSPTTTVTTSLDTPIKKAKSKSHNPPKPPSGDSSVLAVNCCKIVVVGEKCRFICRHPGCEREYASRDAVRKHCRLRHLAWLRGLERTAVHEVEVLPPRDPSDPAPAPPKVAAQEECAACDDTSSSDAAAAVPVAEATVALEVPAPVVFKSYTPGMLPISSPASPAFEPLSPPVLGRMPSLTMLSPIVLPQLPAGHEMSGLPPLDLPHYVSTHVVTQDWSGLAGRLQVDLFKNPNFSPRLLPKAGTTHVPLASTPLRPAEPVRTQLVN